MDAFIKKGFYTIGALKTNRILYPCGIKQKIREFALHLRKTDSDVSLVTVGSRSYYVYRYEESLNGIDNAAVLISYPKDGKRLIFLRRDNAIFFPHNSSQEMRASCSIARSRHFTILWRRDNASKSCHH